MELPLRLLMALILCGGALQEEEKERHFYVRAAVGRGGKKVLVAFVCGQFVWSML
jgi:hypothetical protein